MTAWAKFLWRNEEGQDIAEYAVMLAVILVIVIGTVRLIGTNANSVFSQVASGIGFGAVTLLRASKVLHGARISSLAAANKHPLALEGIE
jgi:Flp pilus assembly pilin Flp